MIRSKKPILLLASLLWLTAPVVVADEVSGAEIAVEESTPPAADSEAGAAGEAANATPEPAEEEAPEEEKVPALVLKGRSLIEQLEDDKTRIDLLAAEAKTATGEDLEVLERQIAETKLDYLATIDRLVRNLQAQEKAELEPEGVRTYLAVDLTRLGPAIVEHIDASRETIRIQRKQRETATAEEMPELERAISREVEWLELLFQAYSDQIQQMRVLELDNAALARDLSNRLAIRADRLLGRTQLVDEQLLQLRERSEKTPDDTSLVAEIELARHRKETLTGALGHIVDLMDASELDSSQYRQFLIRTTGNVTVDVFRTGVMASLLDEWTKQLRQQLRERGPIFLGNLVVFLLILLVFKLLATIIKKLTEGAMTRSSGNISQLQRTMLLSLASRGVMIIGVLVALSQLGIELGPLLAGLGIAGFIVGFALQDSLANFASGVMILAYRPFDVDDFIEAGGVRGKVSYMSLVSTTIHTFDNQTLIVPNSKIWGDVIKNITNQENRRVDMEFHVSYDDDMEHAERTFLAICKDHPKVLDDPEPMIKVHKLGKSSIEYAVRPWVLTEDYWEVHWDVTREVRRRFLEEGLAIPLPVRDVRVRAAATPASPGSGTTNP